MNDDQRVEDEETTHSRRRLLKSAISAAGVAALAASGGASVHRARAGDDEDDDDQDNSGSGSGGDDEDHSGHSGGGEDDAVEVTGEVPAGSIEVRIVSEDADGFQPNDVTVDMGQSVTFVNVHDDEHTATGSGFDTGEIERGATATVVLDEPGQFAYACSFHPEMTGTISVRDENGNVPEPSSQTQDVPADAIEVQIVNFAFEPAAVTVPVGGTIVWVNNDSAPHTATGLDGSFDSNIFDPGASFAWQFTEPGTVPYRCSLHPAMEGTIEVTGDGEVSSASQDDAPASIVGAWLVAVGPDADAALPPQQALATFHQDGAIAATFATVGGEDSAAVRLSDAHGTWEASTDGFTATIAAMSLGMDGSYAGLLSIAVEGQVDESGDRLSGSFTFEAIDEGGGQLAAGEGTIDGQRVGSASTSSVELDATPVADGASASAVTVSIADFAFDPAEIEVTAGTTVTWANADAVPHTATADDGAFDTGRIDQGQEGSATFTGAGTFAYHCDFHPDMVGTVTVV